MSVIVTRLSDGQFLRFDGWTRADFTEEAIVSDHPVELGAEVTDHIQHRPSRFVVEALITESPAIPRPAPLEEARRFLEACMGKQVSILIPGEGTYPLCALESYTHSRTYKRGRAFTLRVKTLRVASALSVTIPARTPAPVAEAGAPTEVDLGVQSGTPGVPPSTLANVRDAGVSAATTGLDAASQFGQSIGSLFGVL